MHIKKFFLIFFLVLVGKASASSDVHQTFIESEELKISKNDQIVAENLINVIKLVKKAYVSQDVMRKVLTETSKSKHFEPFIPWLKSIQEISKKTTSLELMAYCRPYAISKEILPLEKRLERYAGNYCREKTLEAIGREIEKKNTISEEAIAYIQENLKFYLTKKNKKNFAFFIQSHSTRPEILKRLSQEVTTYSVQHQIVPGQDVLKDILITDQITKLIQDKGFSLQNKNVFYTEFGKMIENGYKLLDTSPNEDKLKELFSYMRNYLDLNQDHLPVSLCLTRLNDFSKAVFRLGYKELSRDVFKFIIRKNDKELYEDALFFYLWTYIHHNEFKEALNQATRYNLTRSNSKITDPLLKFWIGHTYEQLKDVNQAVKLYEDIVFTSPLSFYAIMSVKRIQQLQPSSAAVTFYASKSLKEKPSINLSIRDLDQDYISSLIRLKSWAKIDAQKILKVELRRIKLHSLPNFIVKIPSDKQLEIKSNLHLINAKILEKANYLTSFRYLYEALDQKEVIFNRSLLETLYPKPYYEDLMKIMSNQEFDPIVVLSLIRQESVFNPLARSPVGARGLMQLMPKTAKRMKRSVGDKQLVNPQINLELGTKYFKNLYKRYNGNLVYVLAAYNAGEARVERWRNNYFDTDGSILKNIETIPFLETRNYVKLIFRNIFFYKLLLQEQNQIADSSEPNKIFDVSLGFKR